MKWLLTIFAVAMLPTGVYAGLIGNWQLLTFCFLCFASLLCFANIDQIAEFKASGSGIEAKTKDVIRQAESTIEELKILSKTVATTALSLVVRNGRIGGYSEQEKEALKDSVFETLDAIGVPREEFEDTLTDWHKFTEFDYAHFLLGGSYTPSNSTKEATQEWKALRNGITDIPSPNRIEAFLLKHECLTPERTEILKDYRHYIETRTHRRPEVWAQKEKWPRLEFPPNK